jgi:hypothetical protein
MYNFQSPTDLNMARSLDAEVARMRDDSYVRKVIEEQATKYRSAAAACGIGLSNITGVE